MNFDIRGAVIRNIHNLSAEELENLVTDSINQREEKLLPGLGVLFEVIWKNSSPTDRDHMIQTLHQSLGQH
jgi:small acid-soluble spore protein I (minor)